MKSDNHPINHNKTDSADAILGFFSPPPPPPLTWKENTILVLLLSVEQRVLVSPLKTSNDYTAGNGSFQ